METLIKVVGAIVVIVGIIALIAVLCAWPTEWLINYLFTRQTLTLVFGTPQISFAQALGINVLCGILFKSSTSSSKK